jgi:hypothetical protein
MARITDYTSLGTALQAYTGSTVFSTSGGNFDYMLSEAEEEMNSRLRVRRMLTSVTPTVGSTGIVTLPSDFAGWKRFQVRDGVTEWDLNLIAADQTTDVTQVYSQPNGTPRALITNGATSQILPYINGSYTFVGLYYAKIPQLTSRFCRRRDDALHLATPTYRRSGTTPPPLARGSSASSGISRWHLTARMRCSTGMHLRVACFADLAAAPKANVLVTQSSQVLAFDINIGGTEYRNAFATCAPGDYTDWSGANATTNTPITHRPGKITAAIAFRDYVLVFKQSSVYKLTYTGSSTYKWRVECIAIGKGAWAPFDVVNTGESSSSPVPVGCGSSEGIGGRRQTRFAGASPVYTVSIERSSDNAPPTGVLGGYTAIADWGDAYALASYTTPNPPTYLSSTNQHRFDFQITAPYCAFAIGFPSVSSGYIEVLDVALDMTDAGRL